MKLLGYILALVIATTGLSGCNQYLAREYGGKIDYKLPTGAQLVTMTWKGSSLWVLYYIPRDNSCVFAESSAVGSLEGEVRIAACNPVSLAKTM